MKIVAGGTLAAILVLASHSLCAQPAPGPAPVPGAPAAGAEAPRETTAAAQKKRAACRQVGAQQGLRGPDLADQVAICVLEARLSCLKQAVTQKIRGPERRTFIDSCLGS